MRALDPRRWARVHAAADARPPYARHGDTPLHRRPEIVLPLLWLVGTVAALAYMTWGQG